MTNDCPAAVDLGTDIGSMQEIPDASNMCRYFPTDVFGSPIPHFRHEFVRGLYHCNHI